MLFLSLGMAWAQTATLEVSTNVTYPEYQYKIKNNGDNGSGGFFWMGANTAPTQNNVASFAFFAADGDNAYKIYSIGKKQWVSYNKEANSSNCKNFAVLVDSEDEANAWYITKSYRRVDVYQMQPFDSDGNVRAQYMNWYQGVENGGGGYSYDDERTVGLWQDNAAGDNGSGWVLVDNAETVAEADYFVNGTVYTFVTARGWMGAMDGKSDVISTARVASSIPPADVKRTNPDFQWTVYKSANNKYYLYNIGKGQFMGVQSENNVAVPFVATPAGNITFKKSSSSEYPIMFSTDNKAVVNHSANHDFGLISWTGGWNNLSDDGSNHKVVKVGVLDDNTIAGIAEFVNVYELLPALNAAVSELTALFSGKDLGNGLGQYSSSYENYEAVFAGIKEYAANVPANATVADIQEKIDICNEIRNTFSYNKPVAGKYYRIKAVAEWNDDAPYLGSKNSDAKSGRAEFIANADAYSIFLFDGTSLKSYASGHYLVNNSNFLGYNGVQQNGSSIAFHLASNNLKGAYNISFKGNNDGTRWLYVNQGNYTDAAGNTDGTNGYCFNIEEVAQLPVAQSGNSVYSSFADAKAGVKAGETLTLFVDTDETIVLPIGVTLDKNGHSADNVTVATPVAKIGEQGYATLAAAVKAATAGAKITFVDNINESVTLSKNVTIDGANFNYTGTMSANNGLTVTVQNVNFVNGGFSKNNNGTSGTYTIKDCTFDGQGKYAYPVVAKNIGTLNVENCTVKDYQYGFLYVKQQSTKVSVKNVTVENCANYAVYLASGVAATIENLSVKNSNNGILWPSAGARTLNLSGCKFENVKTAINSNGGAYVVTANIHGVNNDFGTAVLSDNVKCVLDEDATLAATTADLNVTTNVEGKEVAYQGGKYSVVEASKAYTDAITASNAEVTATGEKEVTVKYTGDVKFVDNANGVGSNWISFIITKPAKVDATKAMVKIPSGSSYKEGTLASVLDAGKDYATMWTSCQFKKAFQYEIDWNGDGNYDLVVKIDATEANVQVPVAKVGKTYYPDFAEAIAAAEAGQTVTLLKDATIETTINGAGLTIEGNNHTLTYTGSGASARAIDVKSESNGANLTVKNLTIDCTASYCQRGINYNTTGELVLDGVTVKGTNVTYALNLPGSSDNATVTINNSSLIGNIALNVWGENSTITAENSVFTSVDNSTAENYAAVVLNNDGSTVANGTTVTINGGSITAKDENGDLSNAVRNSTSTGVVNVSETTTVTGNYTKPVAIVTYGSDQFYSCATLQAAIDKAIATNGSVKLIADVEATEIITVNAPVVIDGNGKTLKSTAARAINIETEGEVVINNLTVNAGERAFNIINKPATVKLNGVTAVANNNAVMIATSADSAKVTIDRCDFTGLAVVNVAGAKSNVAIKNSTITNVDNNPDENYGAITVWTSAENAVVNVENTTIIAADDSKKAYVFPANATVNGVDEVGRIIVTVGDAGFDTLAEAIDYANGETIKFVMDAEGPGVVINKKAVIDFNGKTYSFTEGVGSTGTPSNGFQILKGNNVTLKNGTLNVAEDAADKFYILVQNYANLTVEGMTLDGEYLDKWSTTDGDSYVLSNNSGTVKVIGSTITANNDGALAFAMDACLKAPYEAPVVTVAEGSTINGNVEVSATLNMNGTLNGTIIINAATGTVIGAEGLTVKTNVADHKVVRDENGAYTVVAKNYVAQVGEAKYETFAAAVAAAPAGGTVTLIDNATEDDVVTLTKNLTIDGAGHTFTGAIEFKKSNGSFTVKNVNFNGPANSDRVYALKSQSSTTNLTVEGCTATGYPYGFLYANSAIANVTVTDVTVKNVTYGVHSARGTNVTLNNFVAENVEYGVMVQNYSGRNVVLNNCSFTGSENPLYIWERNQTYKITFNFKGANEMGKADFCTSAMAVVNADAVAGTKVCGTLAEAVAAAEAGETVTLMRDVQLDALLTIDKSITLDLGEYNIARDGRTAIYVEGDVEVAINGNGTVSGKQALYVGGGLVKVYGGNFHGLAEAVYVQNNGKAEIYGGTFSSDNVDFVLNEYDKTRETSDITVYGGTFVGFNPADNAAEGAGTNFVAEGYVVVDNGDGTYTVKENPAYGKVAKVGEEYYATLTEALAAAAAGTTVELIADVNEDVTLTKNVTINGANFKYTGTMSANANITVNVLDLNFVNAGFSKGTKSSNGNYTFNGCTFDGQGTYSRAIYVRGANKVVLENCTATGYDYFMYVPNALNNSITVKGVTVENCSGYAVMFNSGAGKATFENFTVKNSSTAIIYNNTANRALTLNNCTMENVGTAIRHTGDGVKNITCTFVGKNNLGGADFSEYVVLNNAALAGTTIYASLAEAVAAEGNEVKLLGNSTGAGVVIDKSITIDFNGKTYSFNGGAVGSSNTKSNGFQILKGNNVTLKNGTLNVAEAAKGEFYILIQNYANLTVENMTLDGTNLDKYSTTDGDSYVLSNNSGNVVVNGNTNITANDEGDKAFAFDACDKSGWGYEIPNVTVNTIGKVTGKVEVTGGNLVIYSGTYSMDVNEWCAEGYAATKVADNLWTVIKAIAQVGEVKYASIQDAIDAALDGETVTLLANVTLTDNDVVMTKDGNKTMLYVAGKEITFDMNEKTILVENYSLGNYLLGVFCIEDGAGLTVTGNGAIDVPQLDRQVAYMFWKRGTAGYLVIENGNFHAGNLEDSMIYTNGDEVVTVNGGTFILDRTGERPNGCPWMFNTKGQNVNSIVVNGGTYNTNVSKQHYAHEAKLAEDKTMLDNGDGTWTVIEALAAIDGVGYRTLADAVEAAVEGDYVTLLKDVTDAGIVINKSITIDFNEKTYTVNKAVGSKGTETLGFQILKDNYVTLTNGTLTSTVAVEGSNEIKMLVQNYANLTLEDMNLVDETEHILYALSNNSGATFLTRNTNITTDAVAFDSYYSKSYDAPTVYVETEGRIEGKIEKNDGATIAISSGTFTVEIFEEWCAEYHVPVLNADGTWTVESRYIDELTIVDGNYTEFVNEHEMTVGTLTYERDFTNFSGWQTLFVPFEIPVEQLTGLGYEVAYFYDVHYDVHDEVIDPTKISSVHFIVVKQGTLRANFPYVIKRTSEANPLLSVTLYDAKLYSTAASELNTVESSSTTTRFVFAGTYKKMGRVALTGDDNTPCYRFNPQGQVQKMSATANLVPFRVCMYIKAKDGSPVILDETAAPEYIKMRVIGEENEDGTTTIYDVNAEEAEEMIFDLSGRRVLETEKGIYIKNGKKVYVK